MHKKIGGEFLIESDLLQRKITSLPNDMMFSSGRCAFFYILSNLRVGEGFILVPNYVCDSITRTIKDAGWNYEFYNLNDDLSVNISLFIACKADAVLLINYFGMTDLDDIVTGIKDMNPNITIIEDGVQAFYEYKKTKADYSFTSLRKWFPCPDGAFINTKHAMDVNGMIESKWSQYKLAGNILKNYQENLCDSICLELIKKGEDLLEKEYNSKCSEVSQVIFSNLDIEGIAEIRKRNAGFLHKRLIELGVEHIYQDKAVPLFIPIFIDNRDMLRRDYFENDIFTPIHWSKVSDELNGDNKVYKQELSLICDQRYGLEDMDRQIAVLQHFLDGGGK